METAGCSECNSKDTFFFIEKGPKIVMTVTGSSSFNLSGDRDGYKDFSFFL
jgi:hypothetical protein